MKIVVTIILMGSLFFGCATTQIATDAIGEDAIYTLSLSCKKSYELTQDCSLWSGAKRKITIDGVKVKIAGSRRGDVVLVMDSSMFLNGMKEAFTLSLAKNYHSESTNRGFEAVKRVLRAKGIQIYRVRTIMSPNGIDGYVLELGGDGYSILKRYS